MDKVKHFIVCLFASMVHPMLAIGLAFGKEYGDKYAVSNHWCWMDLLADGIGIAVGGSIRYLLFGYPS